ncbi:MAG: PKD domain-containing protein [bacterium]
MKKIYFFISFLFLLVFSKPLYSQETCEFDSYISFGNYGTDEICPGTSLDFYAYYYDAASYYWDFKNGTTSNEKYPRDILFNSTGENIYELTITNSCGADTTLTGMILVNDNLGFKENHYINYEITPKKICPGELVRFNVWGDAFVSSAWSIGEGDTIMNNYFKHQYNNVGTYPVSIILTNGCGNDTTIHDTVIVDTNIKITPDMADNFSISPNVACPGEEIRFSIWGDFYESISWNLDNGYTRNNKYFRYKYDAPGVYNVSLTMTNACGYDTTVYKTIKIQDDLHYNGNISFNVSPSEVCPNEDVRFYTYEEAVHYHWSISGGINSNLKEFERSFGTAGTYDVSLTLTNGCGFDTTVHKQITVKNDITFSSVSYEIEPKEVCPNQKVNFECRENAKKYIWTFGDGNIASGQRLQHSFEGKKEKYPVTLTIENGCGNSMTITDTVQINNNLPVKVTGNSYQLIPEYACPGEDIFFYANPENINQVSWNFGDGSVSSDFLSVHSYTNLGNYGATLQMTNGCGNDTLIPLTVKIQDELNPNLQEYVYDMSTEEACVGDTVAFVLLPATDNFNVSWDFGDGTSSSSPVVQEISYMGITYKKLIFKHVYQSKGSYKTAISVTNGCGNTVSDTIIMKIVDNATLPEIVINTINEQFEVNMPIQFSSYGGLSATWDFGDGSPPVKTYGSFTFISHTYTESGKYTVTVTSSNSCGETKATIKTINVINPEDLVSRIDADICNGENFNYAGQNYYETGFYDLVHGPDSLVILEIEVHPHYYNVPVDTHFCEGTFVNINGTNYSTNNFVVEDIQYTSTFGCDSIVDYTLKYDTSAYREQICVVTMDTATGKFLITWEKTPNHKTVRYNILKQGNIINVYDSIGSVLYDDLSVFVDSLSEPNKRVHYYKLETIDKCGNVTRVSDVDYHSTIHLQYGNNDNKEGVPLSWKHYSIEGDTINIFESYIIYRGDQLDDLHPIDTVAGNENSNSDNDPEALSMKKYYRVAGVLKNPCIPNGKLKSNAGPFSRSLSNLEDNRQQGTGLLGTKLADNARLSVYPNPYSGSTNIKYLLASDAQVEINVLDMVGRHVGRLVSKYQQAGEYKLQFNAKSLGYGAGIYLLEMKANNQRIIEKIVEMN